MDANEPESLVEIDGHELYGREGQRYLAEPELVAAANAALYLEMPLLLTGEPGCGKTHFAWAAAWGLHRTQAPDAMYQLEHAPQPLLCQVRSDSRARDLLYSYDAVRRFGDAQHGGDAGKIRAADARQYIELGGLGRALMDTTRKVVLIDEIDKAPRDLPNDLLHELDVGDFEIPEIPSSLPDDVMRHLPATVESHGIALVRQLRRPVMRDAHPLRRVPKPLVIITSNVERQLPDAFLRRCVFFHIEFPDRTRLTAILLDHLRGSVTRLNRSGGSATGNELRIVAQRFLQTAAPQLGHASTQAFAQRSTPASEPEISRAFVEALLDLFLRLRELALTKRPATAELIAWGKALLAGQAAPTHALAVIRAAQAMAEAKAPPDSATLFSALPQVGCLIKLREDWERLRPRAASSPLILA
ncbi:MAG: AAA family ATPase [Myxococcales bacterium]|nr:AAA family ATPase [Myxococcales bacterium]